MNATPIVFRLTEFDVLPKDEWEALFLASRTGNLFYHRAFLQAARSAWPAQQPQGLIAGYAGNRLVLLQPYRLTDSPLGRTVEILRVPTADGIEPLVDSSLHGTDMLPALFDFIRDRLKPDLLLGYSLAPAFHAALSNHFPAHTVRQGEQQKGYFLDLPGSTDEFWALYKSNFRSQLRKKIKSAQSAGIEFRTVEAGQLPAGYSMRQAIETHTRLHKMRFDSMNRPSFFVQPDFQVFHTQLCTHPAEASCVMSFTEALYEGQVVGSLYGARAPHAYIYLMIGFDPQFARFSLGNLLIYYTIEHLIRLQVGKFDFKCGTETYKERWTESVYQKHNVYVVFNTRGQVLYLQEYSTRLLKKIGRAPAKLKKILRHRLSAGQAHPDTANAAAS